MDKKNKLVIPFLVLLMLLIGLCGALVYSGYRYVALSRQAFLNDCASLPDFNPEAESKRYAGSQNWSYPVEPPSVSKEEFELKLKENLARRAAAVFSPREYSRQLMEIMRTCRVARPGDQITVVLNPFGETVSGVFRGREGNIFEIRGELIRRIAVNRVRVEYQYLFNAAEAEQIQADRIAKLKEKYRKIREESIAESKTPIARELASRYGYLWDGEQILTKREAIDRHMDTARADFDSRRAVRLRRLVENHTILYFFHFTPPAASSPTSAPAS